MVAELNSYLLFTYFKINKQSLVFANADVTSLIASGIEIKAHTKASSAALKIILLRRRLSLVSISED